MMQDLHRVMRLVEGEWRNKRVLVIGDLMLDRYIWGGVERISPEAPVPVVRVDLRNERAGGAGNVAMNIVGLGAKATLLGFCGDDDEGRTLHQLLLGAGVDAQPVVVPTYPTTSKLRIVGGKQQMLRLDTERVDGYPADATAALLARLESAIASADAVVLSDYAKGLLSEEVCQRVIGAARMRRVPVLVDPKQRSFARYRGATTICPNLTELSTATGVSGRNLDEVLAAGQKLIADLDLECLAATLSEKGIALLRPESRFVAPAAARQVFDVSGAGDTVVATLALALAGGLEMEIAVQLANLAAGIVVSKIGTVPVNREELLMSLMPQVELQAQEKVLSLEALRTRVAAWRSAGESVVFTNGCFELLHIGHITLLEDSRREGDRLVVAINSDSSVQALKGPTRPIVGERERARILAALAAVDAVVVFDDATPLRLVEALRPDVIVKGGDYNEDTIVGAKEVRSWGGRVKIVPIVEGFSTTQLIAKAMGPVEG
ncbi:MAG TPA: bifunctional D-glycero-beta-D-manno-heptose-7-phosphate kinase/D-glycero-beta-D-manno-heptose 1-phosphate adenylyltransferase HldE [Acidobacteriaceae bacterium]|jgi:D-beta-D-heptose 7-phosphate kinase/D-beta-D-heptose 1-phosphate adenosyltransferase|nr:bifunctional D-glycero-beta-D-manno-heptose-7-phosphate kinase/D-glycero-beta-D-manno-heptose 1-phosphate adenylyltransferase HldE [Acidobacteriaceae bacterium]